MREIRSAKEYFRRLYLEVLMIINRHAISDGAAMILNRLLASKKNLLGCKKSNIHNMKSPFH
jgi:hypothetical protein